MSAIAKALMAAAGQANDFASVAFVATVSALLAIDVSDATAPSQISSLTADLNAAVLVYSKKHDYVFASSGADKEIFAIDVSDTSAMSVEQTLAIGSFTILDMALDDENGLLYAICDDSKLRVYDVSTPNSITYLRYITVVQTGDSARIALDIKRKRLLLNTTSTAPAYTLRLIDVSSPRYPVEIDTLTTLTDEASDTYAQLSLNIVSGHAIQLTEARSRIIDYSSDVLSDVSSQYTRRATTFGARRPAYYRARDKKLFAGNGANGIYDLSSGAWSGTTPINSLPMTILAHDDYRLVTFGYDASGNFLCYDTSDPTVDVQIGSLASSGSSLTPVVTNTASASATKAYGR